MKLRVIRKSKFVRKHKAKKKNEIYKTNVQLQNSFVLYFIFHTFISKQTKEYYQQYGCIYIVQTVSIDVKLHDYMLIHHHSLLNKHLV